MEQKFSKSIFFAFILTIALYFSGLLIFLTPLPLVYIILRHGLVPYYATALIALLLVAAVYLFGFEGLQNFLTKNDSWLLIFPLPFIELAKEFPHTVLRFWGVGYFVFFVLMSYAVAVVLTRPDKGLKLTIIFAIVLFLGVVVTNLIFISPQADVLITKLRESLTQGLQQMIDLQEKSDDDIATVLYLKNSLAVLVDYTIFLMPAYLLSRIAIVLVLNIILARRFFGRFFPLITRLSFARFRMPFVAVWSMIFLVVAFLLNYKFTQLTLPHFLILNVFIVVAMAYFFQGFVVLDYVLDARKARPFTRFFVYVSIYLLAPIMMTVLIALGFFDSWLDVRKLDHARTP